jgi:hypothetical protein
VPPTPNAAGSILTSGVADSANVVVYQYLRLREAGARFFTYSPSNGTFRLGQQDPGQRQGHSHRNLSQPNPAHG